MKQGTSNASWSVSQGLERQHSLPLLWHVVKSDEVPESLQLDRLEGDQEYLNLIAGQWLRCQG